MKELQVVQRMRELSLDDDDEPPLLEVESAHLTIDNQQDEQERYDDGPSLMDDMVATAQRAKQAKRAKQEKEGRNNKSFGRGLKKGFFNAKPSAASLTSKQKPKKMPTVSTLLGCGGAFESLAHVAVAIYDCSERSC